MGVMVIVSTVSIAGRRGVATIFAFLVVVALGLSSLGSQPPTAKVVPPAGWVPARSIVTSDASTFFVGSIPTGAITAAT